jgi:hypothetical protein
MNWATPFGAIDSSIEHRARGSLHQRAGQAAAAIAARQRALAIDPGHKLARLYLAQAPASRAAET